MPIVYTYYTCEIDQELGESASCPLPAFHCAEKPWKMIIVYLLWRVAVLTLVDYPCVFTHDDAAVLAGDVDTCAMLYKRKERTRLHCMVAVPIVAANLVIG